MLEGQLSDRPSDFPEKKCRKTLYLAEPHQMNKISCIVIVQRKRFTPITRVTLNKIKKRYLHEENDVFLRWNFECLFFLSEYS